MRALAFACAFIAASGTTTGCSAGPEREVLAITWTKTYHTRECPPVHMAKTVRMTAARAEALHYAPCPVCRPGRR